MNQRYEKWFIRVGVSALICIAWMVDAGVAQAREEFPSLDAAVAMARSRAPASVDARGAATVAESLGVGARVSSFGNPYLEIVGDRGRFTQDVQLLSTLYLPIEIQGQRGARVAEWERLVAWKRAGLGDVLARTLAETTAAYGDVLVARARLVQADVGENNAKQEADAYAARLRAGDVTVYDVSVAESEVARWSQLRVTASVALTQALARLAQVTGAPTPAPIFDTVVTPQLRSPLPTNEWTAWLSGSPTLRAIEAEAAYWRASGERAGKESWSPLNVVITGGRGDLGEGRVGAGLAWSFPVFRRNQGEVARAASEEARATAVQSSVRMAIGERLRGAAETFRIAVAGVEEIEKEGIPSAERVVTTAAEAQRSGKGEIARVLIARRDLAAARARRLDLVQLAWASYAELAAFKGDLP